MKQFFLALYTLLIVAGCTKSTVDEIIDINKAEFYANIEGAYDSEPDTKTYIDDLIRMRWSANDKISMFNKTTYLREFTFTGKTGANAGGFRQTSTDDEFWYGADVDNIYAVYPYSEDMQIDETSCAITLIMPAEQTYAENSFGLGANTMVAVSTSNQLVFKNVGSWLRVRLYGENTSIASVTLTSLGDEAIAGEAEVTATLNGNPTCVVTGKTKSIKLTCPTPVQISTSADTPTDFWVVVPPVTLKNGLSVTVEDSDGGTQTYEVNKSFTFERNKFYNLKREVEIDHGIPNNQIWYTSTDGNIVTPYNADGFCASIISNTYKNGKGVITFDNDVTIIGSSAFKGCDKLLSITIPTSVTIIGRSAFEGANLFDGTELPDSIISIEDRAFYAANIKRIVLSNSIKTIGVYAFSYCDKLEEIVIPDSVEEIGDEAFNACNVLKSFYGKFASTDNRCLVDDIGALRAFAPSGLESYDFPVGIKKIYAYGCAVLSSMTIPSTVDGIDYGVIPSFLVSNATTPPSLFNVPESVDNREVIVPANSYAAYRGAPGWCKFIINGVDPHEYFPPIGDVDF